MRLQDLPRPWAKECLRIPTFCLEELGVDLTDKHLLVGYSTGLDSTVLLYMLQCLAPQLRLRLTAAYAHHGLRKAADKEEQLAREICHQLGISYLTSRLDIPALQKKQSTGIEETARQARYVFLEKSRAAVQADFIVTGHHVDDLCEDILMRLVRGTAWPGLGGMTGFDAQRSLLRPLLSWPKKHLHAFAQACSLTWMEDLSNTDLTHTRNRFRHMILPLFHAENPAFAQNMLQLWKQARIDAAYWTECVDANLPTAELLPHDLLTTSAKALRLRLYKRSLERLGPGQAERHQLFLLDKRWTEKAYGRCIQFSGDKIATISAQGILFGQKKSR